MNPLKKVPHPFKNILLIMAATALSLFSCADNGQSTLADAGQSTLADAGPNTFPDDSGKSSCADACANAIVFTTTGSSFSPVITVTGTPKIEWIWEDGTTDNSARPVKDYGSAAIRINKLKVTPWSALIGINIGYDAGDGGSDTIDMVPDQHVSSVSGLEVVAPYLQTWCSSYNKITSLDFSNFTALQTIECYLSSSLETVNLSNTPALRRACFEDCNLNSLDLSQSPNLEDLRGAANNYDTITFGTIGAKVWHICTRDNLQITNRSLFTNMTQFPNLSELYIWNDNQSGALYIPSTSYDNDANIQARENAYTSADFTGALRNPERDGIVNLSDNQITSINITGCKQINSLSATNNKLNSAVVDSILHTLDTLGRHDGTVDLTNNAAPSSSGQASAASLRNKGWSVSIDTN